MWTRRTLHFISATNARCYTPRSILPIQYCIHAVSFPHHIRQCILQPPSTLPSVLQRAVLSQHGRGRGRVLWEEGGGGDVTAQHQTPGSVWRCRRDFCMCALCRVVRAKHLGFRSTQSVYRDWLPCVKLLCNKLMTFVINPCQIRRYSMLSLKLL